jgi:transcriptional regulator with XRE-family HTH domain
LSLTQTQLGQRVSVTKSTIHRYEAGLLKPSPYVLLLLWRLAETEDELRAFSGGLVDITRTGTGDSSASSSGTARRNKAARRTS